MRIWISGGGTAGHVYPALTVLGASTSEQLAVTWFGRPGSLEEAIVTRHGFAFQPLAAAPVVGVGLLPRLRNLGLLAAGTVSAWRQIGADRPDVALVTGGYVSVPLALAARLRCVPMVIYLPDVRPGKAVQLIARLADRITTTHEDAVPYLPGGKTVVTGYPVRPIVRQADRAASRQHLGLAPSESVVLVFGGSQGARRLNEAVMASAEQLLARCSLLHATGRLDLDTVTAARGRLATNLAERWHVTAYFHDEDMAAALAAADLVVSRAGASILGEFPARGLPAILVPLPIAGGHQADNAQVLVRAGAAVCIANDDLDGERLAETILELLDHPARLTAMGAAARSLDRPDAAASILQVILSLTNGAGNQTHQGQAIT
jgi:UDP-N-acetylglucosamine--N-acetylmuramyl-(pentapeptide) pyrophosphoryl-undecaprenol N-acetylglucosamine transferase